MAIKLQELRRYAIEERTEITVIDSATGNRCQVNSLGQVKIADEDRGKGILIEQVFGAADTFEVRNEGKPRRITAAEMERAVGDLFKSRGVAVIPKDED
ncbi:MAG: hypothetical protein ACREDR_12985 [Blastocatellia bacterium]